MTKVSLEQIRSRLAGMNIRKGHYEWKSEYAEGKLRRHEVWRHDYLSYPYLIGAPDERLAARFKDIYFNTTELGGEGKIGILPTQYDGQFIQKFTHLLEEYGARGGHPPDHVIDDANAPIRRYFENGDPIAVKMFSGYEIPSSQFLVKYGQKEFLEPMLREGRIRICPASYYNNDSHLESVRDDEMTRNFYIPTFQGRINGEKSIDVQGHQVNFNDDDIELPLVFPDYFLFSLCDHIYYRMPTDFNANSALIIRDPVRFSQRLISSFLALRPDWEPFYGPVTYYDPYLDYTKFKIPEMAKHFGYSYQREVRIAFRSKVLVRTSLQPEFLKIGPMTDYAELVCA